MPKKRICPNCGAGEFKRRSTTYPLVMQARQINVGRVSVNQCTGCGYLIPTADGQAKLLRSLGSFAALFESAGKATDELAQANLSGTLPAPVTEESARGEAALRSAMRSIRRFRGW